MQYGKTNNYEKVAVCFRAIVLLLAARAKICVFAGEDVKRLGVKSALVAGGWWLVAGGWSGLCLGSVKQLNEKGRGV